MLIYVVDDNETNLVLFSVIVRKLGQDVEVQCFADPLRAIEACDARIPDLVLVDYMMPQMNGHEFVVRFLKIHGTQTVPIVMVTAATDREIKRRALDIGVTDFLPKPVDIYEMRARLTNLIKLRRSQIALENHNLRLSDEVKAATQSILDRERELIHRLTKASECRDPETGAHIIRMAEYSHVIAHRLGLSNEVCDLVLRAAPMHDIGKVGIPDEILLKPGKLTMAEYEVMKSHTKIGYNLLMSSKSPLIELGAKIALSHHEKHDGSGYPNGISGDDIPIEARVVALSDVFDALTSARRYKRSWTLDEAVCYIRDNRGSHFDPNCVDAFLAALPEMVNIEVKFRDKPFE